MKVAPQQPRSGSPAAGALPAPLDLQAYARGLFLSAVRAPTCTECQQSIHGRAFPGQTHRECFEALDGPYTESEGDSDE